MITNQHILVNESMASGGSKTKNFLPFLFRLAAGGLGGAALKMIGNFWVLPRASLSSAAEARKVSRFVQNMFERSHIIPQGETRKILDFNAVSPYTRRSLRR